MQKLRKLTRYWQARLRPPTALPFFWHIGRPNFGDDINPSLFGKLLTQKVRLITHRDSPHFLGMGSILERASPNSIVLGSGFLTRPQPGLIDAGNVVAVRGALSAAGLRHTSSVLLGDPMVLLPEITPLRRDPKGPIGLIPHISDVARARRMDLTGIKIIDPADNPWEVVKQIAGCSRILSQSLHGLIVADALQVPNIWLAPSPEMKGGAFKFEDYYSTINAPKRPLDFTAERVAGADQSMFTVGRYIFDRRNLLEAFREAARKYLQDTRG